MSRPVARGSFPRSCSCGWTRTYDTAAKADYAQRRHSCERSRAIAERKARGDDRRARWAALDRSPKSCLHPNANHVHGFYATYTLDGCRCQPCTDACTEYERNRVRQNAYGRANLIAADPARQHVRALMAGGMGLKRICQTAHVSHGAASKLIYGMHGGPPSKRLRRDVAERLLAVRLRLADGAIADHAGQVGVARRLQALIALGWSASKLGQRLGIGPSNMTPIVNCRRQVTVRTHRAVVALYDELSMTLPPEASHRDKIAAARSRRRAREQGWLPPLALDDDRLDDPTYLPHLGDRETSRPLAECERVTGIKAERHLILRDEEAS